MSSHRNNNEEEESSSSYAYINSIPIEADSFLKHHCEENCNKNNNSVVYRRTEVQEGTVPHVHYISMARLSSVSFSGCQKYVVKYLTKFDK